MWILIAVITVLLLLMGLPLYVGLFGISFYLFHLLEVPWVNVIIQFEKLQTQEFITALPLFTLAGYILARSRSADRMLIFFRSTFHFISGFEVSFVLILMATFTALTGASGIGILALGGLLMPILRKSGFSESFSLGLMTSSGGLGLLLAPSLPVIVYAIIASQSQLSHPVEIDILFRAAFVPFLILMGIFLLYSFLKKQYQRPPAQAQKKWAFSWKRAARGICIARYELPLPFLIYGGIYTGLFTVMEASVVITFYVIVIIFFVHRDLSLRKDFLEVTAGAAKLSGSIFMIIIAAMVFKEYFVQEKIPEKLFGVFSQVITNKLVFLLAVNLFLLIVGCFLDIFSAILIVLPILLPIVTKYDINAYHFAIIFLVNLEMGYLTPPVGMNLFIASYRFKQPITALYRASLPFLVGMFLALMLFTYVPFISTFWTPKKDSQISSFQKNVMKLPSQDIPLVEVLPERSPTGDVVIRVKALDAVQFYEVRYADFEIVGEDDLDFAEKIQVNAISNQTFQDITLSGLQEGQTYTIAVRCFFVAEHFSAWSSFLNVSP